MKDTNDLSHALINEFGSLDKLLEANPKDISRRCNVSENTSILISMIPQLTRRYLKLKSGEKPMLDSSSKAGDYAVALLTGRVYEGFYVICLDSQNRVNHTELVHEGTINEAPVYPRIIVETALRHRANSIILAHNHPGGTMQPSLADIEITKKITTALEPISIKVIDHIIVAGDSYYSFAEKGLVVK